MKKNSENQEPEEYGGVKAVLMAAGAAVGGLLGYEIARNALNINLILLLAFIGAFLGRHLVVSDQRARPGTPESESADHLWRDPFLSHCDGIHGSDGAGGDAYLS